ncbi:MAG TPA: radical SAM protein [Anaerolineales bacterium]|nr:radical SAM protein [Anaerolineales bacterium]
MQLTGLHILLTYRCTLECDHCFLWSGPRQTGVLGLSSISRILAQAAEAGVSSIYFEGGEPFLYYAELVHGVQEAARMGFEVGIVSNAYWAISVADAAKWLQPFVDCLSDLEVSSDLYHCDECLGEEPQNAIAAAKWLHIPTGMISIAPPEEPAPASHGQLLEQNQVMYRGRAAERLAPAHLTQPWDGLRSCVHEDLRDPGRLHVDPHGNLHICQGIVIGNLFERPLRQICAEYDPEAHPVCGALLRGGPRALATEFGLEHRPAYADGCHLCYEARVALRPRFPALLGPDQIYGVLR